MIAATNYEQHRSAERRNGGASLKAASRARHIPVALNKHQDRSALTPRAGLGSSSMTARLRVHCGLPVELGRAFGLGRFSRVGWCFNTARDFLEFNALTRAGVQSGHAVAMLDTLGNQPPTKIADASTHSFVPSNSVRLDDRDRDREAEGSVPNRAGEIPNRRGAFQHECC